MPESSGRDAALLADLTRDLEPEQLPFYTKSSDRGAPAGWYWRPAGADRPRWLGRNVIWAERKLLAIRERGAALEN